MPTGMTSITGSNFRDASGRPLANGRMSCWPVNNSSQPVSAKAGTAGGGPILVTPVTFLIVNGAITTDTAGDPPQLCDTTLTRPENIGYRVRLIDTSNNSEVLGPGYDCVQPSGTSWSFDTYTPYQPALVTVSAGPPGPKGDTGATGLKGDAGTTTLTGSNGDFTIPGLMTAERLSMTDTYIAASGNNGGFPTYEQDLHSTTIAGPGHNLGNSGGWSVDHGTYLSMYSSQRGIGQALSLDARKVGVGDFAGFYAYARGNVGLTAGSDEGYVVIQGEMYELAGSFNGTVSSTTGRGDTKPVFVNGAQYVVTGIAVELYNTSSNQLTAQCVNPPVAGTVVNFSGFTNPALTPLNGTSSFVISSTPTSFIAAVGYNFAPFANVADHGLATIYGNNWTIDGAYMLNLSKGTLSGTLTGPCSALVGYDASGAVLNSLDIQALPVAGVTLPLSTAWGYSGNSIPFTGNTRDLTTSQNNIPMTLGKIGSAARPFVLGPAVTGGCYNPERVTINYAGPVITSPSGVQTQIVNLTCSNPNGPFCLFQGGIAGQYISPDANLAFSGQRGSYPALGSLTGTDLIYWVNVAGDELGPTYLPMVGNEAWTPTGPNSAWHLYPGCEIVANLLPVNPSGTDAFDCVLEQNDVPWQPGDRVCNPDYPIQGGHAAWFVLQSENPTHPGFGKVCIEGSYGGHGISGSMIGLALINGNPESYYATWGGPLAAPTAIAIIGPHDNPINIQYGPAPGRALIEVGQVSGTATSLKWLSLTGQTCLLDYTDNRFSFPGLKSTDFISEANPGSAAYLRCTTQGSPLIGYVRTTGFGVDIGLQNIGTTPFVQLPANSFTSRFIVSVEGVVATTASTGQTISGYENILAGYLGNSNWACIQGNFFVGVITGTDDKTPWSIRASDGAMVMKDSNGNFYAYKSVNGALVSTQL